MLLDDLQKEFLNGIFNENTRILDRIRDNNHLTRADRLQIYRNNTFLILTDILRDSFPAVTALGGEKFFRYLAHEFIKIYPPTAGNMDSYGANFPDFIARFPPLKDHPYMSDVARLEWARHESYLAADSGAGNLHPSIRMIQSPWPIDLIWKAAIQNAPPPRLDARSAFVVLFRKNRGVEMWAVSEDVFTFFKALQKGKSLPQATKTAQALNEDFNADLHFANLQKENLITDRRCP